MPNRHEIIRSAYAEYYNMQSPGTSSPFLTPQFWEAGIVTLGLISELLHLTSWGQSVAQTIDRLILTLNHTVLKRDDVEVELREKLRVLQTTPSPNGTMTTSERIAGQIELLTELLKLNKKYTEN